MIAVPLTAMWVMPAGLVALFLMPLHLEALALVPMGWGAEAILWVARTTAALPDATIDVPHIPAWGLVPVLGRAGLAGSVANAATPRRDRADAGGTGVAADGPPARSADLGRCQADRDPHASRGPSCSRLRVDRNSPATPGSNTGRSDRSNRCHPRPPRPRPNRRLPPLRGPGRSRWHALAPTARTIPRPDRPRSATQRQAFSVTRKSACCGPIPTVPAQCWCAVPGTPRFCQRSSVIVSAEPARGLCPRPWPKLVDRFTVWRYGSTAVWLDREGARVLTDRTERGDRPWVTPLPKPRKAAAPALPPAALDHAPALGQGEQPAPVPDVPPNEASKEE